MERMKEIKNKSDYYVTVIKTPSLQKLPVIQTGNKINHRLIRKAKLHNSVPRSAPLQYIQPYELITHLPNIF
jgi:hypothetical protein